MEGLLEFQPWMMTIAIGVTCIVLFLKYLRRNDDYWKVRGVPYEPRASLYKFYKTMKTMHLHDLLVDQVKKYGKIYGGFEMSEPYLMVGDPELLKYILVKDFNVFSSRRDMQFGDKIFDNMVTVLRGEEWKKVRTTITPTFTSRKMRHMAHIINDCTKTLINNLEEYANKEKPVNVKSLLGTFTMDVIASTAFATKINSHHDPMNPFVKHARDAFSERALFRFILFLILPQKLIAWLNLAIFNNEPMKFFERTARQVIEERKKKNKKANDFLQLMIDAANEDLEADAKQEKDFKMMDINDEDEEDQFGKVSSNGAVLNYTGKKKLTQEQIIAQCVIFFVVGYETTASTLSFIAYNLAVNPECQEKLIQEIDDAFDRHGEISYDVIRDMKYLDAVVSETLRMFPPLVMGERCAQQDYKLGDTGITIPKGMFIRFPIYALHYCEEYYPEPEKFNPERFLDPGQQKHTQYAYLPFGAGPRNCLGMRFALMEIKVCLSNVLRRFRFKLAPETSVPPKYRFTMGFLSTADLPLLVESRTDITL